MTEIEVSTRDRVVDLLNQATVLTTEKEKLICLTQVQELIIHFEPELLDSFFEDVVAFQVDRNSDVRKFVVGFIEEACKKDANLLPRLIPNIYLLLNDNAVSVTKRVIQAVAQLLRLSLAWVSTARTTTAEMGQVWHIVSSIKLAIIDMVDHENDGVRTQVIKFLESLILLQTYTEPDSLKREGEFNLDQVPLTLKMARPRKLEEEARIVLNRVIKFQGSLHISSVNLMTCMSSLTIIARARPQFMGKIVNAMEILHANLPPTLSKSQVTSVRKHLKIQLMNLIRHAAAYDYKESITTVLEDLGVTQSEVTKALPGRDELRRRVKRDKPVEVELLESGTGGKRPRPTEAKSQLSGGSKGDVGEGAIRGGGTEKSTAVDVTQKWLADQLDAEMVTNLVMVTMLNLPETIPDYFPVVYTPVTSAGSASQIQHVSRLLASQMTAQGLGPGAEQLKADEEILVSLDSDEEPMAVESISDRKQRTELQQAPLLLPAGVGVRSMGSRTKSIQLSEVTKPLSAMTSTRLQVLILKRLLRCGKGGSLPGGGNSHRIRIVTKLCACLSLEEAKALENYILDDPSANFDVLLSWLFVEHSISHEFLQLSHVFLPSSGETHEGKEKRYSSLLCSIISGIIKGGGKEKHEFLMRLFLECPMLPDAAFETLLQNPEHRAGVEDTIVVVNILKEVALWRPGSAKGAIKALGRVAVSNDEVVKEAVQSFLLELVQSNSPLMDTVSDLATQYLHYLREETPSKELLVLCHSTSNDWTEPLVRSCLQLFLAIVPLNPSLIHGLALVYVKTVNEAKRAILRLVESPVRSLGMDSTELLALVENCPKGGETLVTRIIHILTEKAPPSDALVCRVRELYNRRVSDVRFLIPVLTGLSKKEVVAVLPKLIKLNPHVVKEVFNRLWGVTLDTGASPLTPVDLLVALHLIDTEKADVKTVIRATGFCFAERSIYTAEVLATVLQQLMDATILPTLFMRSLIQALAYYPKLLGFVVNILQRLILKEVWKEAKVWEGFIRCCQRATPQSLTVLLQLPAEQLMDVLQSSQELNRQLFDHVTSLTEGQRGHIPPKILEVILRHRFIKDEVKEEPMDSFADSDEVFH